MGGSDSEIGKTEVELRDLGYFLAAYGAVTGERLSREERGPDPPDFICTRPDGTAVGVELTKIMRDFGDSPHGRLRTTLDTSDFMDVDDAVALMYAAAERKAELIKRAAPVWLTRTILVLQLMEIPGKEVANHVVHDDFADLGFAEVWAADWMGIEAFGDVELVGLHPSDWRGYHRSGWRGKPYG